MRKDSTHINMRRCKQETYTTNIRKRLTAARASTPLNPVAQNAGAHEKLNVLDKRQFFTPKPSSLQPPPLLRTSDSSRPYPSTSPLVTPFKTACARILSFFVVVLCVCSFKIFFFLPATATLLQIENCSKWGPVSGCRGLFFVGVFTCFFWGRRSPGLSR